MNAELIKALRRDDERRKKMIKLGETNCHDCYYATKINTDTYRCRRKKYDVEKKTCFVPKICKVEKNQRLVNHIMEFDAQGKEYDWYEQHIALIDGERKDGEDDEQIH